MPQVFVGIGSNIDRENNVRHGVNELREEFGDLQLSSVYETEAVGFSGEPFFNLVAGFATDRDIAEVARILRDIEDRHGRIRGDKRYSSRTLDIDLLLYGDSIISTDTFHVPRDEILRYAFVLQPLAEIAPELCHPEIGKSMAAIWGTFDIEGQRLKAVEFSL